ncbi:uncharacterized protein [Pyrus communis]|uniref:uncharacterized protein n=1 Tax=Pyrus communis TaxID=23211 RepID=UPI0035C0DA3C
MSNLNKLDFTALEVSRRNYLKWVQGVKLHLTAKNLHPAIEDEMDNLQNEVSLARGNLLMERWVETTSWFLDTESAAWWEQELRRLTPVEKTDWDVFKELFKRRFVPPEYIDRKKQEFTELRQRKMTANEYYRKFTDLSRYHPDVAGNPAEMLRRFRLGTKKKWRSMATTTHSETYQDFYEILLRIEDSENMSSDSDEEKDGNQKKDDKGKGQASLEPRQTQNFKRGGASSSSSSGGFSASGQGRGGRFSGGARGQRQGDGGRGRAPICRRVSSRSRSRPICHHLHRSSRFRVRVVTVRQVEVVPTTTRVMLFHMLRDSISIPRTRIPRVVIPVAPAPVGGSQWYQGGQYQQGEIATSSAGSSRQSGQPSQGRGAQGRGVQSGVRHGVISALRAKKLLSKGCQGYLAHVVLDEAVPNRVEDVRVVRHFPDVFPEDLPGVRLEAEDRDVALLANFQVRPILVDRVLEAQVADRETQELIQAREQGRKRDLRVRDSDGMLMLEGRMFVPNNVDLKKEILDEAHISAYAMHPGATKMYHTIRPFYYWPGMKREIAEYVSRCAVCQQVKAERKKPFGLL